jgi:hypothetical protein
LPKLDADRLKPGGRQSLKFFERGERMAYCPLESLFDQFDSLPHKVSDGQTLSEDEQAALSALCFAL